MDYQKIIQQCLDGNRKAQRALFDHFAPKMLFLCRRYAVDDSEAEDMVQEGFIRLYTHLDKFRNTGAFEGWVRRIFINSAIKFYHRNRNHSGLKDLDGVHNASDDSDALQTLSEKELLGLLTELPDGYRVVFNLYAIEGFSHAEIAEMLHIQESTSRSQLVKARKLLQVKVRDLQRVIL